MTFEEALKELKNGKKIRRKSWAQGTYWFIKKGALEYESDGVKIPKVEYIFYKSLLQDDWEIYQEPILDEKERNYLSFVIKPFRDRVNFITLKKSDCFVNSCFIKIIIEDNFCNLTLPYFELGKMYKNMELGKKYTLKELGL